MSKHINRNRKTVSTKSKSNSKISFVNLSTYTSPEIIETKNKEWVEFGANMLTKLLLMKAKAKNLNNMLE